MAERSITVDHVTIYRCVQRFTPEFIQAAPTSFGRYPAAVEFARSMFRAGKPAAPICDALWTTQAGTG